MAHIIEQNHKAYKLDDNSPSSFDRILRRELNSNFSDANYSPVVRPNIFLSPLSILNELIDLPIAAPVTDHNVKNDGYNMGEE